MPVGVDDVVAALGDALSVAAQVALHPVDGVPHAVVRGPSGVATWVDLAAVVAGRPGASAAEVAAAVLEAEGWDGVDLDRVLDELCRTLGICDALRHKDRLVAMAPLGIDSLVDAILDVEGLDPSTGWRGPARAVVARHVGSLPA